MEESFQPEVAERLRYYVYRLIDPRNGETFYVGKGRGNRLFQHVIAAFPAEHSTDEDEIDLKLKRIAEIRNVGLSVLHIVHRHGLDEGAAYQVEAALIDAYPGLTNRVSGHGSSDYGVAHASELIRAYSAMPFDIEHKLLVISVQQSLIERGSVYEAVRYAWRLSRKRAEQCDCVLAHKQGLVIGVFVADQWLPGLRENFPGLAEDALDRWGFVGREADEILKANYMGKRVPDRFRRKGAANPVRFLKPGD